MEKQSIEEYEKLEKYYWWFVGRRRIIGHFLKKYFSETIKILDWGCGPGGNFEFLGKYGDVLGVDASEESISFCKEKGITNVIRADTLNEFQTDNKFDLVTNFDVLEHIDEDEQFLRDLHKFLKPNGHVLITVPAYHFLWSGLDEALGHKRRYTRGEITEKFRRNGYGIIKASYFVFFLAPAFILFRMFQKINKKDRSATLSQSVVEFPGIINRIFASTLFLEACIIPFLSLPLGTSIIILAKVKNENN